MPRAFHAAGFTAALLVLPLAAFAVQREGYMPPVRDADAHPVDYVPQWEPEWITTDHLVPTNHNVSNLNGAQSETAIAVDPTDPLHIIASSNDLSTTAGLFESFDGGNTWTRSTFGSAGFCYDTWCWFNSAGDAWIAYECSNQSVAYKNHGEAVWHAVNGMSGAGSFPDRSMVTGDNTGGTYNASVYIGYDDNGASNTGYVLYSRTGKGATSWVRSARINDAGPTIGVNAAVGADGVVHAAWLEYAAKKLWVDRSTNGGAAWGTDVLVHTYRAPTGNFFIFIPPQNQRGIVLMPFSTVAQTGPFAGRYYVTYTDYRPSTSNTAIYLNYSDDGGATWSTEKEVTGSFPGMKYAFHPTVASQTDGTVAVNFYGAKNTKTRQFCMFSHDGGNTWVPTSLVNADIAGASSDETSGNDVNQYGDYQNITASPDGTFGVVWTDKRAGNKNEDLYYAAVVPVAAAPQVAKGGQADMTTASATGGSEPLSVRVVRNGATARLAFRLAQDAPVKLLVADATGRVVSELMDGIASAGDYDVAFDGRDGAGRALPTGVYLYMLESGGQRVSGKMVLAH